VAVTEGLLPDKELLDGKQLFGDLGDWISQADLALLNLECPLTARGNPLAKTGPNLKGSPAILPALKQAGFSLAGLANNHILDYGPEGVQDTIDSLERHHIDYFGAGLSLKDAAKWSIQNINGVRVAFCGMAEHEFSIAGSDNAGANPLDLITFQRELDANKGEYDVLIVLVHGGAEHYPYPTPNLQKTCRFLVERGASAVVCQHSHCVGCVEYHCDKPIVYGQGNFFFPKKRPVDQTWCQGLILRLDFTVGSGLPTVWLELLPVEQSGLSVDKMKPGESDKTLKGVETRSTEILDDNFVSEEWARCCSSKMDQYLPLLLGYGRIRRRVHRLVRGENSYKKKKVFQTLQNIFSCESHHETVLTILKSINKS